jgi:hypothetical protein
MDLIPIGYGSAFLRTWNGVLSESVLTRSGSPPTPRTPATTSNIFAAPRDSCSVVEWSFHRTLAICDAESGSLCRTNAKEEGHGNGNRFSCLDAHHTAEQIQPGKTIEGDMGNARGGIVGYIEIMHGKQARKIYIDCLDALMTRFSRCAAEVMQTLTLACDQRRLGPLHYLTEINSLRRAGAPS